MMQGKKSLLSAGVSGHRKHLVEHNASAVGNFGLPAVAGAQMGGDDQHHHQQLQQQQQQQQAQQSAEYATLAAHTKTYTVPMRVPIHNALANSGGAGGVGGSPSGSMSAHATTTATTFPPMHGASSASAGGSATTRVMGSATQPLFPSMPAAAAVWGVSADEVFAPTIRTLRTPAALAYAADRPATDRLVASPLKNFLNYTAPSALDTASSPAAAAPSNVGTTAATNSLLAQVLQASANNTTPAAAAAAILANQPGGSGSSSSAAAAAAAAAMANQTSAAAAVGPAGMKVHKQIGALSSFAGVVVVDLEREKEQEKEREWAELARQEELRQQKEEQKRREREAAEARRRYAKQHPIYQPPEAVRAHREQIAARLEALKKSQPKLPSQIVKIDFQRRHSLLAALQKRPDQAILKKKRILRGLHEEEHHPDTGSIEARTNKIDSFLKSRPTSEHLKTKNIIQTGPTAVDRAKSLSGLLQRRAPESQLKHKQILKDNARDAANEEKSNKSRAVLAKMLQDRPGYNKLIQQHVAVAGADNSMHSADVGAAAAAAAAAGFSPHHRPPPRESFSQRQETLKTLLANRPQRPPEMVGRDGGTPHTPHRPSGPNTNGGSLVGRTTKLVAPGAGGPSPSHGAHHGTNISSSSSSSNARNSGHHGHAHHGGGGSNTNANNRNSGGGGGGHGARHHHNEPAEPGGVYMWGRGTEAQLGLGVEQDRLAPVFLDVLRRELVVQVSCGLAHTVLRTENGNAYVFGQNSFGQLCLGDRQRRLQPFSPKYRKSPLYRKSIIWVAAGDRTTGFITDEHEVYLGGFAGDGALGIGPTAKDQVELLPVHVADLARDKKVDKLALGSDHSCALTEMGDLYTWGRGARGQLGHDDKKDHFRPKLLKQFTGVFVDIACGDQFNAALTSGKLFTWGANTKGQCGLGTNTDVAAPKQVTAAFKAPVQKVVCGRSHIVALTEDGNVYSTLHKPDTSFELEHEKEKEHESELVAAAEQQREKQKAAAQLQKEKAEKAAAMAKASAAAAAAAGGDDEDEKVGTFVHLKPRAIFHDISAGLDTVGLAMSGVIFFWNTRNGQLIEKLSTLEGMPTQAIAAGDLHYAAIAALPPGVRRTAEETTQAMAAGSSSGSTAGGAGDHSHRGSHHHTGLHGSGHHSTGSGGGGSSSSRLVDPTSARKGSLPGLVPGPSSGGGSSARGGSNPLGPGSGSVTATASAKRHSSLDLSGSQEVHTLAELSAALAQVSRKAQKSPEPTRALTEAEKQRLASKRRGSQPALERSAPSPTHGSSASFGGVAGATNYMKGTAQSVRRGSSHEADGHLTAAQLKQLAAVQLGGTTAAGSVVSPAAAGGRKGSKSGSRSGSRRGSVVGLEDTKAP